MSLGIIVPPNLCYLWLYGSPPSAAKLFLCIKSSHEFRFPFNDYKATSKSFFVSPKTHRKPAPRLFTSQLVIFLYVRFLVFLLKCQAKKYFKLSTILVVATPVAFVHTNVTLIQSPHSVLRWRKEKKNYFQNFYSFYLACFTQSMSDAFIYIHTAAKLAMKRSYEKQ